MAAKQATPELRFPEFDEAWEVSSIDEIASFRRGSFPQPYGLKKWYDDENGFPFIQVFDVGDDLRLKQKTKRQISDLAKGQSVFVPKGSIVLTIQGSIGRIAVTQYDACCDRTLLIFTGFKVPLAEMYFVYALFLRFEIEKKIAVGGTIKTITKEKLRVFPIPLPPLPEQRKIADFLTAVDGRIGQLIQKKALLEDYKKGVMQQLFTQAIRFKDDHGNDYPDWEEAELGEVLGYEQPTKYIVKSAEYSDENPTPVLTAGKTFILGYTDETDGICDTGLPLIIFDDFTTAYKFVDFPFKVKSSAMKILRTKGSDWDIRFVHNAMSTIRFPKGEHKRYWIGEYQFMTIPAPSPDEQTKIADFLSAIDRKIESVATQITETQTFKRGLLQQMFV